MALAQILLRRGTSAEWAIANPVLAAGEFGYDSTAKRAKVGDGQNAWTGLSWVTMSSSDVTRLEAAAAALQGATAPTDAAMTTIQANPNSAFAQAQKATIDAVGGQKFVPLSAIRVGPAPSGDTTGATDQTNLAAVFASLKDGETLVLPPGAFYITGNLVLNRSNVTVRGAGSGSSDHGKSGGTRLLVNHATNDGLIVQQNGITLEDFSIVNTLATIPTGGVGLRLTTARHSRLSRVTVYGFYDNIGIESGIYYVLRDCYSFDPARFGIRLRNTASGGFDTGDQVIEGCTVAVVTNSRGNPLAGIRWESGGGPKIIGCKINGNATYAGEFAIGIDAAVADGGTTMVMSITGCSIENVSAAGIKVSQGGTTGAFGRVMIVGNEIGSGNIPDAIRCEASALGFISDITISGNVAAVSTRCAVWLQNVERVAVSGNMFRGNFSQAGVYINGCNYVDIAPNIISGTFAIAAVLVGSAYSRAVNVARQNVEVTSGSNVPLVQDNRASQLARVPLGSMTYDERREVPGITSTSTWTNLYRLAVPQGYGGGVLDFSIMGLATGGDSFAVHARRLVTRPNTAGSAVVLATIGTDAIAGTEIDYSFDTSTAGEIAVRVRLKAGAGATNLSGEVSVSYRGPLSRFIRV